MNPNEKFDAIKTQYDKIANDWRHFNTIIWGIPSVAIAIMAGIILAAYQPHQELEGWPRIASLSLGSLLLFALTIETIKKRHHMNAMSILLKRLQEEGLKLDAQYRFPVGISKDLDNYIWDRVAEKPDNNPPDSNDKLFRFFQQSYARKYLTWVVFIAAITVALLSAYEFVRFLNNQPEAYIVVIIVPLAICAVLMIYRKKEQKYIKLGDGKTAILWFIPVNPTRYGIKVQYAVIDTNCPDEGEKRFEADRSTSKKIDAFLRPAPSGKKSDRLKITRHDSDYHVEPANGAR